MRRLMEWLGEIYATSRRSLLRDPAVTLFERSADSLGTPHDDTAVVR